MAANEHPAWYATAAEFAPERTSDRVVASGVSEQPASSSSQSSTSPPDETSVFRQVIESLACLAVAVIVFRAFLLEGYIISTGSMAPSLLGYHKQVVCPDCKFEFAYGVAFDRTTRAPSQLATCPNCGQGGIDLKNVPRNDGDQLLVSKYAYLFNDPNRWEVVVFLNPNNPNQAYVKRVVGLPGETIYVRDGDVYIDGRLQRKTMAEQRAIRIPVFDQKFQASGVNWIPRWLTDPEWSNGDAVFAFNSAQGGERSGSNSGLHSGEYSRQLSSLAWVRYFHWPRLSPYSSQRDRASLETLQPGHIADHYGYNQPVRISERYRVNDLMLAAQLDFSRQSVTDDGRGQIEVQQSGASNNGAEERDEFVARLSCRKKQIICRIDAESRMLEMWIVGSSAGEADRILTEGQPADAKVQLTEDWFKEALEFELSSFDRQATVAINGVELAALPLDDDLRDVPNGKLPGSLEGDLSKISVAGYASDSTLQASERRPFNGEGFSDNDGVEQAAWTGGVDTVGADYSQDLSMARSSDESLSPVAFGSRRGSVQVSSVKLYRDVHYTTENQRHATERPLKLGDDEFFFLGDNSPVSLDSRGWVSPVVPRRLLVGRPLVVHLPSQPGRIKIGSTVKYIRIPDFSRIRCIR
ncbi:MAG: signal peptidase I [Planctomycetaceae bacterium]|jgi:signal peptidase I